MVELAGRLRKLLIVSGFLASLLAVGTDALAGMLREGYNFTSQSISELSAVGAPTRTLVFSLNLTYNALLAAFGLGIWKSSQKLAMRVISMAGDAIPTLAFSVLLFYVGNSKPNVEALEKREVTSCSNTWYYK